MRLASVALLACAGLAQAAEADQLLKQIKAVSREGAGNQEAGAAWRELVSLGGDALLPTLAAMDDASPAAANWLRSAVNALAEKEKAAGRKLPADKLEAFVTDRQREPAARRLAYEVLVEADSKAPERLLPTMLDDPSVELRRDAVAAAMRKAERLEGDRARNEWARLFAAVRDDEQAKAIAKALEENGGKPDLVGQFGIVLNWQVAGPFDGAKGTGYATAYEPETKVDLKAKYVGKDKAEVTWKAHRVEVPDDAKKKYDLEEVGEVDLNKAVGKYKDAVAYAYAVVESDKEQPVEVRFGSITAVKVFLNGKPIFAREEYHHGERFDQYVARGTLKAGKNELLVKLTQNDQKEPWAQVWQFKLRLCDATGGALPVKIVTPAD